MSAFRTSAFAKGKRSFLEDTTMPKAVLISHAFKLMDASEDHCK
jgi:hypothetical protein